MDMFEPPIHIVFTVDGGYAMPLATAICSIASNVSVGVELIFHVLFSDFPLPLRQKVEASLNNIGHRSATITWQEASTAGLAHLRINNKNLNSLVFLRLLIPQLLPEDVKKAIYLDADVVVLDNIVALWTEPVGDVALLAVRDRIGSVGSPAGLQNYRELGIPADAKYFNSGVLVLNLERWRKMGLSGRILQYIAEHPEYTLMEDQDGLNAVLFADWGELDFRWNWQVVPNMKSAIHAGCWGLGLTEKSIVHFVTSAKPWLPGSQSAERTLFYHYLDMTVWRGWRVPVLLEWKVAAKRAIKSAIALLHVRRNTGHAGFAAGADS